MREARGARRALRAVGRRNAKRDGPHETHRPPVMHVTAAPPRLGCYVLHPWLIRLGCTARTAFAVATWTLGLYCPSQMFVSD